MPLLGVDSGSGSQLVPAESYKPPPGKTSDQGRWYGNQWMDWGPTNPNPNAPVTPAPAPVTPAPAPPTAAPTAPTDVYREAIQSMLAAPAPPAAAPTPAAPVSSDGPHMKFVRSIYGGFVPFNHPDADPNSPEIDLATGQPIAGTDATTATGTATTTTTSTPGQPASIADAYQQQMLRLLTGQTPEEAAADVNNSPAVAAFRNEQMRTLDRNRAGAAEQSGLNGLQSSGGFQGQTEALRQQAGENTATYAGEQANTVMAARRAELMQAITLAQSQGQFEQAQALQLQLAKMDDATKNRGLDIQSTLGEESNANQRYATEVQKMLGMDDTELRRYLGDIQNQTNRYGIDVTAGTQADRLGYDYSKANADFIQDLIDKGIISPGQV